MRTSCNTISLYPWFHGLAAKAGAWLRLLQSRSAPPSGPTWRWEGLYILYISKLHAPLSPHAYLTEWSICNTLAYIVICQLPPLPFKYWQKLIHRDQHDDGKELPQQPHPIVAVTTEMSVMDKDTSQDHLAN